MKNIIKKIFIALGLLTGGLAALIPMSSYAEVMSKTTQSHTEVIVAPVITLELSIDDHQVDDKNEVLFDKPVLGTVDEAGFTATVSTNQAYTLSLNALDGQTDMLPAGVASEDAPTGGKIPGTGDITDGATSWGVKLASDESYSAIPAVITKFYDGPDPVLDAETKFKVGLATGTGLLQGTYSSTLVVTAATQ